MSNTPWIETTEGQHEEYDLMRTSLSHEIEMNVRTMAKEAVEHDATYRGLGYEIAWADRCARRAGFRSETEALEHLTMSYYTIRVKLNPVLQDDLYAAQIIAERIIRGQLARLQAT